MKLSFATVFFLAASLMHANATNEPLKPTPPKAAVLSPAKQFAPATESLRKKDVFSSVASTEAVVSDIVGRFQTLYAEEMSHSSLLASVATVLKAERTNVRGELMQKEMDTGGLGIDFVEETQTQQYRLFLLMKYQFASTVLGHNRPYVTVMRLTMDCYNVSSDAVDTNTDEQVEYDNAATSPVRLACDVLEHMDLPRRNESIKSIPDYIQRQIAHSAPPSYSHSHSLHVYYDAIEAQDLASDNDGKAIANRDTMHYVKFRVQGGNARDCVIAVEHANGINTLRYLDTVCYDSADADAAMAAAVAGTSSHFALDRSNAPAFVLIASIAGACVAILLVWRQRHRQRSGYSYLSSNTSKLSAVPTPGTTNTDAAVAC